MSRRDRNRAKPGAPADSAPEPSTPAPAPESPTIDPRVTELEAQLAELNAALSAAHESYGRDLASLRAELDATREESDRRVAALREDFNRAWVRREEEFASMKVIARPAAPPAALPDDAPVKGRVLVATCLIRAHTRAGEKVTIPANQPIPDDVDVASLDKGTYAEKGA